MIITHKHLLIYDKYASEKANLEKYGSEEEKALFSNGEFEKISEMLEKECNIRHKSSSKAKTVSHKAEVARLLEDDNDHEYLTRLSKKYYNNEGKGSWINYLTDAAESLFYS